MNDTKNVYPASDNKPFRMPIEEIFNLEGLGLMVIGPIQKEGSFKEGDDVSIIGGDKTLKAHVGGIDIRGDSVGIVLQGVTKDQIEPGMFVTTEDA